MTDTTDKAKADLIAAACNRLDARDKAKFDLIAAARDMLTVWDGMAHPELAYRPGAPSTRLRDALAALDATMAPQGDEIHKYTVRLSYYTTCLYSGIVTVEARSAEEALAEARTRDCECAVTYEREYEEATDENSAEIVEVDGQDWRPEHEQDAQHLAALRADPDHDPRLDSVDVG